MKMRPSWVSVQNSRVVYLSALYRRIAARRGAKRAVMAVAHALLVIAFHMLKRKENYRELGADHFDRIDVSRVRRSLVRRLERLGHRVTLEPWLRSPEGIFVGVERQRNSRLFLWSLLVPRRAKIPRQ